MNLSKRPEIAGLIFSVSIGLLLVMVSPYVSFFNIVILGLVGGIIIGNFFNLPNQFDSGIKFTGSKFLEFSILFLAFDINISNIKNIGIESFLYVIGIVVIVLFSTIFLNKRLKCPGSSGFLVGFGTAICGSSAIAALAPSVSKNKEDVGISLAVVNLIGTIGMLTLPFLLRALNFDSEQTGIFLGASLHSVGNVAGAAYGISEEVGKTAITIKLARVALLPIGIVVLSLFINNSNKQSWKQHLNLPYYLWGFIGISILVSVFQIPGNLISRFEYVGKVILTIAMTAIGMRVGFRNLFLSGKKAIIFGLLIFFIQLVALFTLVTLS